MAANTNGSDEDEEVICRICHLSEEEMKESLIKVCLCRGSVEFVHQSCIGKWVQLSKQLMCVCGYELRTRLEKLPGKLTIKERFEKSWEELRSVEEWVGVEYVLVNAYVIVLLTHIVVVAICFSFTFTNSLIPVDQPKSILEQWWIWAWSSCYHKYPYSALTAYLMFLCLPYILPRVYICKNMLRKMWHKKYNYKLTVETIE